MTDALSILVTVVLTGTWSGLIAWNVIGGWVLWMKVFPALAEHEGKLGVMRGMGHVLRTYGRVCKEHRYPMRLYVFMQRSYDSGPSAWMGWVGLLLLIGAINEPAHAVGSWRRVWVSWSQLGCS